jgi:hypothetical protein
MRLIRWNVEAFNRGASAVKIYGLFHDVKETHYLVTKARRDLTARELYEDGSLKCEGFAPAGVPEDLKKLRAECGRGPGHESYPLLQIIKQGDEHYPAIPDEASLQVVVDEPLRKRLAELRLQYPGAPLAKRLRIGGVGPGASPEGDQVQAKYESVLKLLEKFTIKQRGTITGDNVEFAVLWIEAKSDARIQLHVTSTITARNAVCSKAYLRILYSYQ